jgi:hypothetical protein
MKQKITQILLNIALDFVFLVQIALDILFMINVKRKNL